MQHADQSSWGNEPCPAWCDGDHPSWPDHMGAGWMCFVRLSTEDPVLDGQTDGGPAYQPKELEIYVQQGMREVGPRVAIGQRPTGEPKINLLPDEARHLGEGLIRLAAMADDDRQLVKCEPCDKHEA
ncbi:hypothetical protein EV192_109339 [Actinocrispum wychmicini]|uniref:Uncharacterized protein n=2 Tax=Actinocrispum wychmicini TaxID=1213861 RepID=A0A4R2JC92_9PSEU|nr:hypothetical protein EV192_109339 [Actinocrispum wychmicini]